MNISVRASRMQTCWMQKAEASVGRYDTDQHQQSDSRPRNGQRSWMQATRSVKITQDRLPDAEGWLEIMLGVLQYVSGATSLIDSGVHSIILVNVTIKTASSKLDPLLFLTSTSREQGPEWRCTAQLFRATWHTWYGAQPGDQPFC